MFDPAALNQAVADTFCNKTATWGATTIQVALAIMPTVDEEGYQVGGESITADCPEASIPGMKRKDTLIINAVSYSVLAVQPDGSGWATIVLEKA